MKRLGQEFRHDALSGQRRQRDRRTTRFSRASMTRRPDVGEEGRPEAKPHKIQLANDGTKVPKRIFGKLGARGKVAGGGGIIFWGTRVRRMGRWARGETGGRSRVSWETSNWGWILCMDGRE